MHTKSLAVTFCETLEVYLREYSRRHKSYVLCFRVPTLTILNLLLQLRAISIDDEVVYRVFATSKVPFVIILHPRTLERATHIADHARTHGITDVFLWYRGRHVGHHC